jgi:hypothetical protein
LQTGAFNCKKIRKEARADAATGTLFVDPNWRRFDAGGRLMSGILASAPRQAADGADGHVMIAKYLATQPNARQAARREHFALGKRHALGLAGDKLDAAGRAARISTARVKLIDSGILLQSKHQALAFGHFKLAYSFEG